jgi:hypothetical protein
MCTEPMALRDVIPDCSRGMPAAFGSAPQAAVIQLAVDHDLFGSGLGAHIAAISS